MGDEVCHLDRRSPELPKAGPPMTFSIGILFVRSPSSHSPRVILNVRPVSSVGGSLGETAVAWLVLHRAHSRYRRRTVLVKRQRPVRAAGRKQRNRAGSVSQRDGLSLRPARVGGSCSVGRSHLTGSPPFLCMETSQLICMETSQGKVRGTVWLGPHFLTSVYDASGGPIWTHAAFRNCLRIG